MKIQDTKQPNHFAQEGRDFLFTILSDSITARPEVKVEADHRLDFGVALYDIHGKRVKDLAPLQPHPKGTWKQELDVEGVATGVYLVAVLTHDGGESVQRVCIR